MNHHLGTVFVSLFFVITSSVSATAAPNNPVGKPAAKQGCQPKGTPKNDVIVCTGIDTDGVKAGRGDDQVVIEGGAVVSTTASDPQPQSTAVDGQADNDTIINHGLIHVTVLSIGNNLKNILALGTETEVAADQAAADKKMAKATGIAGGDGADTIENTGTIIVNTITNTSPSDSSDGSQGAGAKTRSSQALGLSIGIDGGADDDVITNRGNITVTATSIADKADHSEGNTTAPGNSADNKDVNAAATAVGIHGGGGDDTITNTGSITAIASSATLSLDFGGSNDAANSSPQTKSGTTVQATATGIDGGDGNDNITNEQTVSAVATAIAPAVGVELAAQGGQNVDATVTALSHSTGIDGGSGDDNIVNRGTVTSVATSAVFAVSGSVSKQGNSSVPKAASDSSSSGEASATGIAGGSGNDTINNEGTVAAVATVESFSAAGSLAVSGNSAAKGTSTAKSSATGIDAGAGDDTVANSGSITATATSLAQGLGIAVTVKESSNPPASGNANQTNFKAAADASTTAEATAAGIVGDSGETTSTSNTVFTGLSIAYGTSKQAASGDDDITNNGEVAAVATAVSTAASGALTVEGEASAKATSTAKTTAAGIDAGGGNDTVSSSGTLSAVATSIATGLSVGVALKSDSTDGTGTQAGKGGSKAAADASVTAEATAAGILGDSGEQSSSTDVRLAVDLNSLRFDYRTSKEAASGDDTITNSGAIDVLANAASAAGAGAVTLKGDASAKAASTATSTATGIDAGAGNDNVANSGSILAEAGSAAVGLSVGVGLESGGDSSTGGSGSTVRSILDLFSGPKAAADASVTAEATAAGIIGDSGEQSSSTELGLAITSSGLTFDYRTRKEAASGDDSITSSGNIVALANSVSGAGSAEVTFKGNASAKATSTAKSTATGIDAGAGNDTVANSGSILAEAGSIAAGLSVGVALESGSGGSDGDSPLQPILDLFAGPKAAAEASVTAEATAAGIIGDSGERTSSKETTLGIQVDVANETGGISYNHAEHTAGATGDDTITNTAGITVLANSVSGAAGGAVTLEGDASAKATSTAKSAATGINAGAGDDTVTNSGSILAEAGSIAAGLSVGVSLESGGGDTGGTGDANPLQSILDLFSGPKAAADVSVLAEATAGGILGDSGEGTTSRETSLGLSVDLANDTGGLRYRHAESTAGATGDDAITNTAGITVLANSVSGAAGGAVTLDGDASTKATSIAKSTATGIDTGAGNDTLSNGGSIVVKAGSVAAALSIAVGVDSGQSGGTGGDNPLEPILELFAGPKATAEASVTAEATAAGIRGDSGDRSTSQESSLGIQVDLAGNTGGISYDHAESTAGATGDDTITNSAGIMVLANSVSGAIGGAVAIGGDASVKATSTAKSTATGIDAGAGNDTITNSGSILAEAGSIAAGLSIAVGVDSGQSGGTGDDNPLQPILDLFSGPKATAEASVTAEATAAGILGDSGEGTSSKETSLGIQIDAANNTGGLSVSHAESTAGATGDDTITNTAGITALADSVSGAVGGAVAIGGGASAKATSTAKSTATGIDAGAGDDGVTNSGDILAEAGSIAAGLSIAVGVDGGQSGDTTETASSSKTTAEASVTADAAAAGILGDSGAGTTSRETSLGLEVDLTNNTGGISVSHAESTAGATGDDTITNTAGITVLANSLSGAAGGAVAIGGGASAKATSTAKSTATGIDAGAGDDTVTNSGSILAEAGSVAAGLSVGVGVDSGQSGGTSAPASSSKTAADASVTAEATAAGIRGDSGAGTSSRETSLGVQVDLANNTGGISLSHRESTAGATGDDTITNSAGLAVLANSLSGAVGGAVAIGGNASAKATSTAKSTATGIDAGAGDDTVTNSGGIVTEAGAVAAGLSVGVGVGSDSTSGSKTTTEASVTAEAAAAGILGDSGQAKTTTEVDLSLDLDALNFNFSTSKEAASGNDTIVNDGRIDVVAAAVSGAGAVAIGIDGKASAKSTSEATSTATGIGGGAGDDSITNRGDMTATAVSAAGALSVAISTKGAARATGGIWDGGASTQATAVGIAGDSAEKNSSTEIGISADFEDLSAQFGYQRNEESVTGSDTIRNEGSITTTAVAETAVLDVAVAASQGMAAAISSASAEARSSAIDAGGGSDYVFNSGDLTSTAVANANALSVSVAGKGTALAGDAVWSGGVTAEATAKGIDGDGEGSNETTEIAASVGTDGVNAAFRRAQGGATGDDAIENEGDITATAVAATPALAVAIGAQGMAGAVSTSEAESLATAIDAGDGNDIIQNSGELTAVATSVATAVNVALSARSGAVAADAIWDGGITAEATAKGIDADGSATSHFSETTLTAGADGFGVDHRSSTDIADGTDTIINEATIGATAVAVAPAVSVAVSARGVGIASSTATARATATAIDAGSGSDDITNRGDLAATAVANADAVNVAVTTGSGLGLAGNPVWDGGTTSEAIAKGIDADGTGTSSASETTLRIGADGALFAHGSSETSASGHDRITNTHQVDATATAVSAGLTVGVAVSGVSGAVSTSTAKSEATAIHAGGGDDEIYSSGELAAIATSVAASVNVAVTAGTGVAIAADAVFDGGTTAQATAKGIDADGTSTAKSTETTISASSNGTTVDHSATISAAHGQDIIVNEGKIDAIATAVAPSVGVAVAVSGVGVAASTATAQAEATGIDTGAGNDAITNRGELDINAVANANAVNVSVTPTGGALAGNNVWNGGTISEATAKGIDADGTGVGTSSRTTLGFSSDGAAFLHRTAVDAARGDDTIHNEAAINADAVAVTAGVAVGVTAAGGAAAISTSTAKSYATAIDAGDGSDAIANTTAGELTATATSVAVALNVGIAAGTGLAVAADAVWDGGTTAEATAKGIDADGSATSSASETTIAIGSAGASIGHSQSTSSASGDDTLTNDAGIGATATAVAPSASLAVAVSGVAVAASTATAQAEATAIDMGAGNDDVTNRGALDVIAVANADAVNVSVTPAGGAIAGNNVFDGGVTAEARAKGIDADGSASSSSAATTLTFDSEGARFSHQAARVSASGSDVIRNEAKIDADATAVSAAIAVTVPVAGAGLSASTATVRSDTRAIDAGGGDDTIINSALGELNATATSVAAAVNVSVTPAGLAAATDAIWNGGTTAEATAKGIDADGSQTSTRSETTLAIGAGGATFSHLTERTPGTGNDMIVNDANVDANATAVSASVGVSVAVAGVAAAASTATTRADATGIDAGAGNDDITNRGALDVDAVSVAAAVAVSVTPAGVAVTADAVWDGGTTAQASATGLAADGSAAGATTETIVSSSTISHRSVTESASGDDTILNEARIDADAVAVAPALSVPVAVFGVAAAVSNSTARADATGIDAGGGNDEITNRGELTATAVANADTANVAVTVGGVGVAGNSVWDGGTTAEAVAKGIDADGRGGRVTSERTIELGEDGVTVTTRGTRASGSGNDVITNEARITASATAVPVSVAVGVAAIGGVGAAVSTSTATSLASAIDAGGGDDDVTNHGELEATATSTAVTVNGSFALIGAGVSADAIWDGGTTAQAAAFGIDADGRGAMVTSERVTTVSAAGVDIDSDTTVVVSSGNDRITNTGAVVATAKATSPSVAVGIGGVLGAALATSTAESNAAAIDGGGGHDEIDNTGALTAAADSTAVAVNVSAGAVALSVNNVWDGGTTATATAKGIDAGSGEDTVSNAARTESVATATAPAVSVALGGVVGAAVSTATSEARASAIDTGDDDDNLTNSGQLIATADADAVAVNVALTVTGLAVAGDAAWDGGTTADARAKGIDGGKGGDEIANTALIDATADAGTTSVGVSLVTLGGVGASISTSTATSRASAIDGGEGDDTIANAGSLAAAADSRAAGVNVSMSFGGASVAADAVWDGGTTADATARGIEGGAGDDSIGNIALVDASATADSSSVGVSVTLAGVAGASSTSTARTQATAIDGGEDDDAITNLGQLTSTADSSASAVSVAVTVAGAAAASDAVWDGGTTADATARGIDGGGGHDVIANHQTVAATSTAGTSSTGVSVSVIGAAGALSQSSALARSGAIDGGEGDDTIANLGALTADATADARGTSVSVALVGAAAAEASANALAQATGIDGGHGDDMIANSAPLSVMALATAKGSSVEVAVVGAPVANPLLESGTNADATAIGLSGGAGSDTVANVSSVDLESTARTDSSAVSVSLVNFGGGSAGVSAEANARGTGMEGGAGSDVLDNHGDITAAVTAESPVRGVNVSLAGVAQADFSANADAHADGISGGEGDDAITNSGIVELTATARAPANGTSVNIAGVTEQSVSATATASATGADGGAGNDAITNSGALNATVISEARVSGSTWSLAGRSAQQGISNAVTRATGISGGAGTDVIVNQGSMGVSGTTTLRTEGTSSAAFGGTTADASVNGNVTAIGIDGGDDEDRIDNTGVIAVTATSNSTANGSAFTLAGSARGKSGTTATATAIGVAGGLADDLIVNSGVLTVRAATNATASNSAWTLAGGAGGDAALQATSASTAIAGDAGSDRVYNDGAVTADASAALSVNGGAQAIFGGAGSGSAVNANVSALGVDGADGDDWIENTGTIAVAGTAVMTSSTAAFSLAGSPSAGALLTATSQATGISGGNDADWIHNLGNVSVLAQSQQTATGGSRSTVAGGAASSTASRASASAAGVDGGTGDDIVINDGTIAVDANPTGTARNVGAGGFLFGTAGATSDLQLTSTTRGVDLGAGDNVLSNIGDIAVTARGSGLVDARADGGRLVNGSAFATARVSGAGLAHGVQAGDGDNWIYNAGSLSVVAEPRLRADEANANGNGIVNANGTALATASATGQAIGIEAGHGDNRITNDGALSVTARPEATAEAFADSDLAGTARSTARATASAEATGIRAGNGDNQIVNNGTITVLAAPTANARARATVDAISICIPFTRICATITIGNAVVTSQSTESAAAIGIETGSGDDAIVNNGTITVTRIQNDVSSLGIAISSGAGNDSVTLGDGSSTTGHIDLGSGDDTFHLVGTPTVDGNINSGSGTDSLIFDGTGSFSNPLVGFVNTSKQGTGTYTLPSLSTMQRLEIKEGTLRLNSSYTMGSGSTFQTTVNGNGTHGQLNVGGTAGLDGALAVDKGPGIYLDGTTYDIVSANVVSGSFASETLPAPTALVSFSTNQLPAAFQVEASVESFTSVTSTSVGADVGAALDAILLDATGDMAAVLGSLQQLTQTNFDEIYTGISGESHDHFRASTFNTMQRYTGAIHSRMNMARAAFRGTSTLESTDRTQMSQDAWLVQYGPVSGVIDLRGNGSAGQSPPRYGMWVSAFGQTAGQKGGDGYSSFDDRTTGRIPFGFDVPFGNNLIVGFAAGQSFSHVVRDEAVGGAEGVFGTIYGTYFTQNAQVEAVLSRGWNRYENTRAMDLGNEKRVALSRHGGDAFSAALEARYRFDLDDFRFEPFSSLHYSRLTEEGFRETGAGSLNLIVHERETDSLTSQLGFRMVRPLSLRSGTLVPELMVAWKHAFTADGHPITAAFEGAPDSRFALEGKEMGEDVLLLGGALAFDGSKNFSASAGFTTEVGNNRQRGSGLLQLQYKW